MFERRKESKELGMKLNTIARQTKARKCQTQSKKEEENEKGNEREKAARLMMGRGVERTEKVEENK